MEGVDRHDHHQKESYLESIVTINEGAISKKNGEIKVLKTKIKQIRGELFALEEEAAVLKSDLRKKEQQISRLEDERCELLCDLETNKNRLSVNVGLRPFIAENRLLQIYSRCEKEKLKLVKYDNAFKDREIAVLERKLDVLQSEQLSKTTSQSKEEATSKQFTFLENALTPKALAKLQRHATKYGLQNRQKDIRSSSMTR